MRSTRKKKRGPWIDLALITSILLLVSIIIFFTIMDDTLNGHDNEVIATDSIVDSSITEAESAFPGIRIISDMSNDPDLPFAIQYPQTNDENFNVLIEDYITSSKKAYINAMRPQKDTRKVEKLSGELNIHFDTYQYNENYYSFVFTERMSTNEKSTKTTLKTVFYHIETAQVLDIRTLLGEDTKNLETFASHVRELLKANPDLQDVLIAEEVDLATEARWVLFDKFAIHQDELYIYFDEGTIAPPEQGPISVQVSMSFLNPLLASAFQMQMVEVDAPADGVVDDNKKRVALTFDDGPHPEVTTQILDSLDRYNAKGTFFMLGNRVQYYPEIAREVLKRGHEIGNHTWSHPVLPKLSQSQIMNEFTITEQALVEAIGQESTVFRPPYGATTEAINTMIPHHVVLWSIDTLDWKHRDAQQLVLIVKQQMHNNAIILMHDIHQSTADGLNGILDYLASEGYEFVTVSEILPYR
ncbi:polysaccharide deacetylase family protein [Lysinibacillus sp. LZ02]|uniref:polysaccharide deacetylase family protein n=1 Tax=Lysinibacillus sp. LZ02 TaxID=3420668 RepID=UPI003D35D156